MGKRLHILYTAVIALRSIMTLKIQNFTYKSKLVNLHPPPLPSSSTLPSLSPFPLSSSLMGGRLVPLALLLLAGSALHEAKQKVSYPTVLLPYHPIYSS